jgi:cytochrome c oxidase subunit 1
MFIMGWLGMPRRYYDYLPEFYTYHFISTVGSWILIIGLIILIGNLIYALLKGEKTSEKNPWGGESLEWQVETPPSLENFDVIPTVTAAPYEYKMNEEILTEKEEVN